MKINVSVPLHSLDDTNVFLTWRTSHAKQFLLLLCTSYTNVTNQMFGENYVNIYFVPYKFFKLLSTFRLLVLLW